MRAAVAAGLLGLAVLSACSSSGGSASPPASFPTISPADAPACGTLLTRLPSNVAGLPRHPLPSGFNFAMLWGNKKASIQLQCGVSRPTALNATSQLLDVNAVTWFAEPEGDLTRFTAVDRRPYVQVLVPTSISGDQVLVPLGSAVAKLHKAPVVTATG